MYASIAAQTSMIQSSVSRQMMRLTLEVTRIRNDDSAGLFELVERVHFQSSLRDGGTVIVGYSWQLRIFSDHMND